jgi:hypothetical protein
MKTEITKQNIEPRIFTIRGVQVMLDRDLAELFDTETKFVNRAVARNKNRFPLDFVFQLSLIEWESLRFQFGTSNIGSGGRRYLPYVFTEQGVAMLSTALKTEKALSASIQIIRTFVKLRKTLLLSQALTHRVEELELRQSKSEKQIDTILNSLQNKDIPQHGVFFNDQIFDAYVFSCELILKAQKSIILIDNYIDETTLLQLSKRQTAVTAMIYTERITPQLKLDLQKHNSQYSSIAVSTLKKVHDRFIIIDDTELYHIGASLKDLGKKWFAFSRIDSILPEITSKLHDKKP